MISKSMIKRFALEAKLSCRLLVGLAVGFCLNLSGVEIQGTNAFKHWPSREEIRNTWDVIPLEAVRVAAGKGDLSAQHYLGICYEMGARVPQDTKVAVSWYERAAQAGFMPSLNNLGTLYQRGEGVRQDFAEALRYYRLAADSGHTRAMVNLGRLYRFGWGVPRNPSEAMKLFRDAASANDPWGLVNLGWMYGYEETTPMDQTEAAKHYRQAAALGQPDAMYELYLSYRNGTGVSADENESRRWRATAAEAGHADAQCELGYDNERGMDWDPDYATASSNNMPVAVHWYRRAADQNFARGQYLLGRCYLKGKGVEWDEDRGLELIRMAADQGHKDSLVKLADLYAQGIGEPRSKSDHPIELLLRAAETGFQDAYPPLIVRYRLGIGTERDQISAARWHVAAVLARLPGYSPDPSDAIQPFVALYLGAARPNGWAAAMQIAEKYVSGSDAPRNQFNAWLWFSVASVRGAPEARTRISGIESHLSPDELREARNLLPALIEQLNQAAFITVRTPSR